MKKQNCELFDKHRLLFGSVSSLSLVLPWVLCLLFLFRGGALSAADTVWIEDFEGPVPEWNVEGGSWETGFVITGPGSAFQGNRAAGTNLLGNYSDNVDARLISPTFVVPSVETNPRLRFVHWFEFYKEKEPRFDLDGGDYGQVQIRESGKEWVPLSNQFFGNSSGVYSPTSLDLSQYAGKQVEIAFYLHTRWTAFSEDIRTAAGWVVDNVKLVTGAIEFTSPELFDDGYGDWWVDGGTWEIDTADPNRPVVVTNKTGNYSDNVDARLISPTFVVPSVETNPRLRFVHWFEFYKEKEPRFDLDGGDYGQVQIRESGKEWVPLSNQFFGNSSGVYSPTSLDLSQYAGKQVEIAFYLHTRWTALSENIRTAAGWIVDDIELVTGAIELKNPETFVNGYGDWWVDGGTWEIDTADPNRPVVVTNKTGNYSDNVDARLISPTFVVPSVETNPRLKFLHWFEFYTESRADLELDGGDFGQVQIRELGMEWVSLSDQFVGSSSGAFSPTSLDLSQYAGKQVEIAFYLHTRWTAFSENIRTAAGWNIRNIEILTSVFEGLRRDYYTNEMQLYELKFSDYINDESLRFLLNGPTPEGLSISVDNILNWTPKEHQGPGIYEIEVWVMMENNALTPVASKQLTISVAEANDFPIVNELPIGAEILVLEENSQDTLPTIVDFQATATDPDNNGIPYQWYIFSDTFEDLELSPWSTISVASNRDWTASQFGNLTFAQILGVNADTASDDWLISPKINLTATSDETVIFDSAKGFSGPDIQVLVSTDYIGSGDPESATWTALVPNLSLGDEVWVSSGRLSLEQFTNSSNVHIAFHYTSEGTTAGEAALWEVGNIRVQGFFPPFHQELAFSLAEGAPAGATINETTGEFFWEPTESDGPGVYQIGVVVTDDGAPNGVEAALSSIPQTFTVTVDEVNEPPVLSPIADLEVNENTGFGFTPQFVDPDLPVNSFTWSIDGNAVSLGAAIDPASGLFTWTPSESQGPGEYDITLTITDSGTPPLSDSETFKVTVLDVNDPPFFSETIKPQVIGENEMLSIQVLAADVDSPQQTLTFSPGEHFPDGASIAPETGLFSWTPTESQGPGTYRIDVVVTDNGTNPPNLSVQGNFMVTVQERNSQPTLLGIDNLVVDEEKPIPMIQVAAADTDLPEQSLTFDLDEASKARGISIDPEFGLISWTPGELDGPGVFDVTVLVNDNSGADNATAETTFNITVNEINEAPVVTEIPFPTSIIEAVVWTFQVEATDPDRPEAQTLSFALSENAPEGASIDANGIFTWTPSEALGGSDETVEFDILVSDDGTPVQTKSIRVTIQVDESNTPPSFITVEDVNTPEEQAWSLQLSATDTDIPANTLIYSLGANAPEGLTVSDEGMLNWTPTEAQGPDSYNVTVIVNDGTETDNANGSATFTITVEEINQLPAVAQPEPQVVIPGADLEVTITATDADLPTNQLIYAIDGESPLGLSINDQTGLIQWTPSIDDIGEYSINVTVSDQVGEETPAVSLLITVLGQDPVLASIDDIEVDELTTLSFQIQAADPNQEPETLNYTLEAGSPEGMTITSEGQLNWTPTEDQGPSDHTVTVKVTDDDGNSDEETFTINVREINTAPVLVEIGTQQVDVNTTLTFVVTARDNDDPANQLSYALSGDTLPGAALDPANGEFTWTPTEPGTFEVTICVTDDGEPAMEDCETIVIFVAGEFQNLDFEQADVSNEFFFQVPGSEALPHWLHNNPNLDSIGYNVRRNDDLFISIHDEDSLTEQVTAGVHALLLQAGDPDGDGPEPLTGAFIAQLGTVPESAKTLQVTVGSEYRNVRAYLGETPLTLSEVSSDGTTAIMTADVSDFAGQVMEMFIEAGIENDIPGVVLIHSLAFTDEPTTVEPEPVPVVLAVQWTQTGFKVAMESGEFGKTYELQAMDTIGGGWNPIGDPKIFEGQELDFEDPESLNKSQRFYQVVKSSNE